MQENNCSRFPTVPKKARCVGFDVLAFKITQRCLSVCMSVCLFVCLSLCLSVCDVCLCVCLPICDVCLSVCLPVRLFVCPSAMFADCLSVCLQSVCLFVCLSVYLSVCLFVCWLSVCLSVCLQSVCLFVCLSDSLWPLSSPPSPGTRFPSLHPPAWFHSLQPPLLTRSKFVTKHTAVGLFVLRELLFLGDRENLPRK